MSQATPHQSIDDKLVKILADFETDGSFKEDAESQYVSRINAAFESEGYDIELKQSFEKGWQNGYNTAEYVCTHSNHMTGQEWLSRFKAELEKPWTDEEIVEPQYNADDRMNYYTAEHVIEAAERASDLQENAR